MVKLLIKRGYSVVTLDNLSSGFRDAVLGGQFVQGDINDSELLDNLLSQHQFDGVMHFASYIQVGESVEAPAKYYGNNFSNTLNLLNAMVKHNVRAFIFSSTAAIFGEPDYSPIDEKHSTNPINPYGRTKVMVEQALADYENAYGLESVCLRYFNAAGADPDGELGERHEPETHLIPLILQAASGRRNSIRVFGSDYDTKDGTCVRDYIHINDLCEAHILGLERLWRGDGSAAFNLGNGLGFTVQEVIDAARRVSGREIKVIEEGRRAGDPARLLADSQKAKLGLGCSPQYAGLETIIRHAWEWELFLCKVK
jgi:UDP-glucose 4-epimerase